MSTKVFALGGIGEIGKNCYVIEDNDELFIIDCGVKFADQDVLHGINGIIPPFDYLIENKNKIKGLIVTHAHEDHIGGIPYLLKVITGLKIYAAKFTCAMIKGKISQHSDINSPTFEIIDDKWRLITKNFMVEAFKVCHSIPDCLGVYIQTKDAKIVSTGDFRFDFSTEGDQTDINKIAEIGLRDVDLLLCESTNGEKPGFSVSEQVIIDNLRRLITSAKGRVFVSLFASNLERGQHLLQIALQCKRKLVLLGRSMKNAMNTAMDIKYLNIGKSDIIENLKEINEYPDNEVFVLMTGSQGEEMAALNQMAIGNNPFFAIKPTDTIILSSSPIPGNFRKVEELVNKLYKSRANIVVNTAALNIHASGHATQQEQQLMIKLVNPRYLVPIHGEIKMHFALKKTAHTSGIKREQTIIVQNGQKVEINDHVVSATTEVVDTSDVYIDGNSVSNNSDNVLKFRQMMSSDGIFSVVLIFDKEKRALKFMPHLSSRGIFYTKTFLSLITKISYSIKDKIDEWFRDNPTSPIVNDVFIEICKQIVLDFIWRNFKKKPLVRTNIFII